MSKKHIIIALFFGLIGFGYWLVPELALAATAKPRLHLTDFIGVPPIRVLATPDVVPGGLNPAEVKQAYDLPQNGGSGIIAIVEAYHDQNLEADLGVFSTTYSLPPCTKANGCLIQHEMTKTIATNQGWSLEESLDVEWAHAIAPQAKILVVEAKTGAGQNLLNALDYAKSQFGVVAVSLSWGGDEFKDETELDGHFIGNPNITFFAAAGDNGAGAGWPAVSPNVVAVGGTTLTLDKSGGFMSEKAWSGSGGGISKFEKEPDYQKNYDIGNANGMRTIPDVSYNADPTTGFSVFDSVGSRKSKSWYIVGGTSAGAPQWAAIKSLGLSASNEKFYADKASTLYSEYFRDIVSGTNGTCAYYCQARKRYDFVTGLGSPLTTTF